MLNRFTILAAVDEICANGKWADAGLLNLLLVVPIVVFKWFNWIISWPPKASRSRTPEYINIWPQSLSSLSNLPTSHWSENRNRDCCRVDPIAFYSIEEVDLITVSWYKTKKRRDTTGRIISGFVLNDDRRIICRCRLGNGMEVCLVNVTTG